MLRGTLIAATMVIAGASCVDGAAKDRYDRARSICEDLASGDASFADAQAAFEGDAVLIACSASFAPLADGDACDYADVGGACEWGWGWRASDPLACPSIARACAADPERCHDRCYYGCIVRVQEGWVCAARFYETTANVRGDLSPHDSLFRGSHDRLVQ